MRDDAYVPLSEIMNQPEFCNITIDDIKYVVNTNDKKRYTLLEENGIFFIKANQGHSSNVGDQITQSKTFEIIKTPFDKCIHGTDLKSWNLIKNTGLSRMSRQHIHFARSEPSDKSVISGARSNSKVLIYIDMQKAMDDGIAFYLSENGVILTEGINGVLDTKYISNVVIK